MALDLTVVAIPGYLGSMAWEHRVLARRAETADRPRGAAPGDYVAADTAASLAMGIGSLAAPLLFEPLVRSLRPRAGRLGRAAVAVTVGATVVATAADLVGRRSRRTRARRAARQVSSIAAPVAVFTGATMLAGTAAAALDPERLFDRRRVGDLGATPLALGLAVAGWDFVYYWNHRLMHRVRHLWAIHVVHHSSQRYNLSTALRQPWAESFGTLLPYGMGLVGIRPSLTRHARAINLIYQFWIHTETIRSLGPLERLFNTASHHRVHHGANQRYLDKNYGSILIVWDRLFGTFEPEDERVRYGLTTNIESFQPTRITTHEYADIWRDVGDSTTWRDRVRHLAAPPGWSYDWRARQGTQRSA